MRLMDLFDLYNAMLGTVNSQQGGCVKPYGNFITWLIEISTEMFNDKFSNAETSQKNDDILNNAFLKSLNIPVTRVTGRNYDMISLPAGFGYLSSVRIFKAAEADCGCFNNEFPTLLGDKCYTYEEPEIQALRERYKDQYVNEIRADKVDNARFADAAASIIMAPTLQKPIITQVNGGIKIVPSGVGIVVLDYFRLPVIPVFSYTTISGSDVINYDVGTSLQLDWPDLVKPEIIAALKKRYSSFTRNQNQYAEAVAEAQEAK